MEAKHTPTPWNVAAYNGSFEIVTDSWDVASGSIGDRGPIRNAEDAAFIVRACNSHDALVEALKECADRLELHMKHTEDLAAHMKACKALALAGETP